MNKFVILLLPVIFLMQCTPTDNKSSNPEFVEKIEGDYIVGHLDRYRFKPEDIPDRYVDVWLTESFQKDEVYNVIYMHDGQMLFDESRTWNRQEWRVDETLSRMMQSGEIPPTIVVGIWNADDYRSAEYFPEDAFSLMTSELKDELVSTFPEGPSANEYVEFIAESVIPFIEETYPVKEDHEARFMAGSSYGGLISIYTLTKYPEVFGGVAALSTHWPGTFEPNDEIPNAIREYLRSNLPDPGSHKIYFDHGTETLDSLYAPYQQKVDDLMLELGYEPGTDFKSEVFEGTDHSEIAWAERFEIPVKFLLNQKKES